MPCFNLGAADAIWVVVLQTASLHTDLKGLPSAGPPLPPIHLSANCPTYFQIPEVVINRSTQPVSQSPRRDPAWMNDEGNG